MKPSNVLKLHHASTRRYHQLTNLLLPEILLPPIVPSSFFVTLYSHIKCRIKSSHLPARTSSRTCAVSLHPQVSNPPNPLSICRFVLCPADLGIFIYFVSWRPGSRSQDARIQVVASGPGARLLAHWLPLAHPLSGIWERRGVITLCTNRTALYTVHSLPLLSPVT